MADTREMYDELSRYVFVVFDPNPGMDYAIAWDGRRNFPIYDLQLSSKVGMWSEEELPISEEALEIVERAIDAGDYEMYLKH